MRMPGKQRFVLPANPVTAPSSQSGQIGVVILLIMVVILTVGLSVATRTTEQTFLTTQTVESARVFNAAEAGAEAALSLDFDALTEQTTGTLTTIPDTTINYEVTPQNDFETKLFEGVPVALDVTGVPAGEGLVIRWSRQDCAADPAAFLVVIYSQTGPTTSARYRALGNCARGDNFEQAATLAPAEPLRYEFTLALEAGDTAVRLHPLYNNTDIAVSGTSGWTLPTQIYAIRSEARNDLGNETRVIQVNRTLPTAPAILDFAVFSGSSIVK